MDEKQINKLTYENVEYVCDFFGLGQDEDGKTNWGFEWDDVAATVNMQYDRETDRVISVSVKSERWDNDQERWILVRSAIVKSAAELAGTLLLWGFTPRKYA